MDEVRTTAISGVASIVNNPEVIKVKTIRRSFVSQMNILHRDVLHKMIVGGTIIVMLGRYSELADVSEGLVIMVDGSLYRMALYMYTSYWHDTHTGAGLSQEKASGLIHREVSQIPQIFTT